MVRLAVAFLTVSTAVLAPQGALALWPNPTSMTTGSQYLKLSKSISIEFDGRAPSDLQQAIERTKAQLKNDNMERLIVGRGGADAPKLGGAKELKKLTLSLTGSSASDKSRTPTSIFQNTIVKAEEREESYSLTIPADGTTATLTANNTLGLFRGLTTFSQLFYTAGATVYTYNAPIAIKDKAAFPHRGLLLDTARNYYPKADVLRTIDAMSWTKLNVLHWHIVDSQSFPLEVARYPELAKTGAYDPSSIYKISDIKEIVKYAGERGVDILLEIDTPGHTAVVSKSHPEFIACNEKVPWTKYANEPPAGQLRLASKDVITFTSQLFASVLENLPGKYFSTGGDEINANCYTDCGGGGWVGANPNGNSWCDPYKT
ncbi:N-acetyl-glucosamine-6-phosphate deacetylase [Tulasnella sp. 418]|nr:N-acetyl-glucosamine-6-phosphate deacetylase [Tulasnella sp. 418]